MTHKLTEIISAIQHAIHLTKPMLIELALMVVFVAELVRWACAALGFGHTG